MPLYPLSHLAGLQGLFFSCMCCMFHMNRYMCVHMYMEDWHLCLPLLLPILFFNAHKSHDLPILNCPQGHHFCLWSAGIIVKCHTCPAQVHSGNLNSKPHVCMARAFSTKHISSSHDSPFHLERGHYISHSAARPHRGTALVTNRCCAGQNTK